MKRMVAATLAGMFISTSALAQAQGAQGNSWHVVDAKTVVYGPKDEENVVALSCVGNERFELNVTDPTKMFRTSGFPKLLVKALKANTISSYRLEDWDGDRVFVGFAVDSMVLTSLLVDRSFEIETANNKTITIPGEGASTSVKALVQNCMSDSAKPIVTMASPSTTTTMPAPQRAPVQSAQRVPRFNQFEVPVRPYARGTQVVLDDAEKKSFRTRLREAAQGPATFAGHYVIARWGCGTNCVTGAVIDKNTGIVSWFPGSVSGSGAVTPDFEPILTRLDSRMIVLSGMINEEEPRGAHIYGFEDGKFVKIQTVELPPDMVGWSELTRRF